MLWWQGKASSSTVCKVGSIDPARGIWPGPCMDVEHIKLMHLQGFETTTVYDTARVYLSEASSAHSARNAGTNGASLVFQLEKSSIMKRPNCAEKLERVGRKKAIRLGSGEARKDGDKVPGHLCRSASAANLPTIPDRWTTVPQPHLSRHSRSLVNKASMQSCCAFRLLSNSDLFGSTQ